MAGIDNNTVLYLRGDSFKDLSPNPKTITNNGVIIEGKNLKFGNGYLTSSNPFSNLDEFTIDFYINLNSSSVDYSGILGCSSAGINDLDNFEIYYLKSSTSLCVHYRKVTKKIDFSSYLGKITHLAFVKKGDTLNIFIDGVLKHTYSDVNMTFNNSNLLRLGRIRDNTISPVCTISNLRISNIARYTEDFTPPIQPFNSININVTNKTFSQIDFNVTKLGQETINKVEVLVNNIVSKTYTDNYNNLTYNIDSSLCAIGNNKITIRVTYDDNYIEEVVLTHTVTVNNLPTTSSLKDVIDRQELLNNSIEIQKNNLKNILVGKNVEVGEEDKLSNLIDRVNELGDAPPPPLYLYKDGDEYVNVTGGWVDEYADDNIVSQISSHSSKDNNILYVYSKRTVSGGSERLARYFRTAKKVDLTRYNTLEIDIQASSNNSGQSKVSIYNSTPPFKSNFDTMSPVAHLSVVKSSLINSNATIDVSALNGEYYVCVMNMGSSFNAFSESDNYIKIKRLELKKVGD